jgi:hypothetical protein
LSKPPFVPGQFVWCRFPYFEAPLSPGDKERIVYVADVRQQAGRRIFTVMSLYTTTVPWEPNVPLPLGVIPVSGAAAARMKQKPFVVDARRIAFIPGTDEFFPRLNTSEGAVVYQATKTFRRQVESILTELARRPDLLALLGPDAPRRGR